MLLTETGKPTIRKVVKVKVLRPKKVTCPDSPPIDSDIKSTDWQTSTLVAMRREAGTNTGLAT